MTKKDAELIALDETRTRIAMVFETSPPLYIEHEGKRFKRRYLRPLVYYEVLQKETPR